MKNRIPVAHKYKGEGHNRCPLFFLLLLLAVLGNECRNLRLGSNCLEEGDELRVGVYDGGRDAVEIPGFDQLHTVGDVDVSRGNLFHVAGQDEGPS